MRDHRSWNWRLVAAMECAGARSADSCDIALMLHHIERGAVPACKVLLHVLIHEIRVEGRDRVVPWFRVPGGADLNVRALAGWAPPALHNANLSTELPGDVLSMVGVHAKVRRDGYRR